MGRRKSTKPTEAINIRIATEDRIRLEQRVEKIKRQTGVEVSNADVIRSLIGTLPLAAPARARKAAGT